MRVVLDTNQFVSALIRPSGQQGRILREWTLGRIEVVVSEALLLEIQDVLRRSYFLKKHKITEEKIVDLVDLLRRRAVLVVGDVDVHVVPDDPTDDMVLACAAEAHVDYIVSGDSHLLGLKEFQSIPIVTATTFLEFL